VVYINS